VFADDTCREFEIVKLAERLESSALEAWVVQNIEEVLRNRGAEVEPISVQETPAGIAVVLHYREPAAAPCSATVVRDGNPTLTRPDVEGGIYVVQAEGSIDQLSYRLGVGASLGDWMFIQRGPLEPILREFVIGFEVVPRP
jgi:hypothetical protein